MTGRTAAPRDVEQDDLVRSRRRRVRLVERALEVGVRESDETEIPPDRGAHNEQRQVGFVERIAQRGDAARQRGRHAPSVRAARASRVSHDRVYRASARTIAAQSAHSVGCAGSLPNARYFQQR